MTNTPLCRYRRILLALFCFTLSSAAVHGADSFVVQWKAASRQMPWLSRVEILSSSGNVTLSTEKLASSSGFPKGVRVRLRKGGEEAAWVQVKLGGGYGFTFSDQMLDQHPYLWVRDLGIYISRLGTWAESARERAAAEAEIKRSLAAPYVSCAEKYSNWTGYLEYGYKPNGGRGNLDDRIWDFVTAKEGWPLEARAIEHIASMPEVDAQYFDDRFPDLKYSRFYLGWPDHDDKFTLWNNGKIGVSSASVGGDPEEFPDTPWQPRASGYSLQFGVGDAPRFREYGDDAVRQHLMNGFDLIGVTEWSDADMKVEQTNFAYPLEGEQVKTGIEPLLNWTRIQIKNVSPVALDTYLGIEFTNEDFGGRQPLANFQDITWRKGGFFLLGTLLAVTDPALEFEETPTTGDHKRFRARIQLPAEGIQSYTFANFYRPISPARLADVQKLGYQTALERTKAFWTRLDNEGASITVPDPLLNNLYRTFLPRMTINSELDLNGLSVMQTGPIIYNRIWHHSTCYGIADYLCPRGYFALAKRYLEPIFHWQGIPGPDSPAIKDWSGFFGAPREQCPLVWLMYQGMVQWASARYFQLSGDRPWLDEKLPALLKSMDWVKQTRSESKKLNADGSKPLNYGWFPPGRVTDGSHGTSVFSDANIWRGMEYMAQVLETIHHPRAAEFRDEADDYRQCIQDGMRRAAAERPLVRLNDDSWVPYFPAYLEKLPGQRESTLWYAAVVDGPWMGGMLDTYVFPLGSPENDWLVNYFEDSYSPMNPSLPDEPQWATSAQYYLYHDQVKNFLYTLYSQSTVTMARQTLTTFEHHSWGKERVFELTPWAAGYWGRNFTDMLARAVGDDLWLMQATPRRWMKDGEKIEVKNLQTEFGPVSYSVTSHLAAGNIEAKVSEPTRQPAGKVKVRFRVPDNHKMQSVTVNGNKWNDFDPAGEWVTLPGSLQEATIVAQY
jgi:hypothetical protein